MQFYVNYGWIFTYVLVWTVNDLTNGCSVLLQAVWAQLMSERPEDDYLTRVKPTTSSVNVGALCMSSFLCGLAAFCSSNKMPVWFQTWSRKVAILLHLVGALIRCLESAYNTRFGSSSETLPGWGSGNVVQVIRSIHAKEVAWLITGSSETE